MAPLSYVDLDGACESESSTCLNVMRLKKYRRVFYERIAFKQNTNPFVY